MAKETNCCVNCFNAVSIGAAGGAGGVCPPHHSNILKPCDKWKDYPERVTTTMALKIAAHRGVIITRATLINWCLRSRVTAIQLGGKGGKWFIDTKALLGVLDNEN